MTKKRARTKSKGTMVAWSNGERIHLSREELVKMKKDYEKQWDSFNTQLKAAGFEWVRDAPAKMRGESQVLEDYSDRLWEQDHHVESLLKLMEAATHLIDWDTVVIGPEINYYHRNLERFRYLIDRCWERVKEDPMLKPLLVNSMAYSWYREMEEKYRDGKNTGWINA
ncbi:MAG: hypothetical protein IJK84_09195 [Bacteroidales bacterium]|nr:hypothetical protein [Bacteroidales bacterium]